MHETAVLQSLLSLPYLGFVERTNPTYIATREFLLSRKNPYYARGKTVSGIGYRDPTPIKFGIH